jgi:hypothetical protein
VGGPEAFGDFIRSIILSDFFSDHDNVLIAKNLFVESGPESFSVGNQCH